MEKIEVVEGAMSTLYGSGSIGGVVNIITKKNEYSGLNGNIKIGTGQLGTKMVSGAGLNKTVFPVINAATIHPTGMAQGKFQGGVTKVGPLDSIESDDIFFIEKAQDT